MVETISSSVVLVGGSGQERRVCTYCCGIIKLLARSTCRPSGLGVWFLGNESMSGGQWREGCVDDFPVDKGDRLDSCSSQLGG